MWDDPANLVVGGLVVTASFNLFFTLVWEGGGGCEKGVGVWDGGGGNPPQSGQFLSKIPLQTYLEVDFFLQFFYISWIMEVRMTEVILS